MSDAPTLLLSGAQGLLGRELARQWLARDADARVVGFGRSDRLRDRYPYDLDVQGRQVPAGLPVLLRGIEADERYDYRRCDVTDADAVAALVASVRPDVVVHAAAALRDDDAGSLDRTNIDGTGTLADRCARSTSVRRFVLVSSGSVHGLSAAKAAGQPLDPYPVSKLAAEHAAARAFAEAEARLRICRVFNLIGPGLQTRHLPARVAADLVAIRAGADPELHLGSLATRRDLVDVADAAAGVLAVTLGNDGTGSGAEPVDVGSGVATLMRDLVAQLVELAGLTDTVQVHEGEPRPYDPPSLVADTVALDRLGARPTTTVRDSCLALLDYLTVQLAATG